MARVRKYYHFDELDFSDPTVAKLVGGRGPGRRQRMRQFRGNLNGQSMELAEKYSHRKPIIDETEVK